MRVGRRRVCHVLSQYLKGGPCVGKRGGCSSCNRAEASIALLIVTLHLVFGDQADGKDNNSLLDLHADQAR